ncbi:MAG TPA: hypothetical protein EYQ25_13990 [Planctomycetes bacterium]|nr:hypothetical protein [Planctomycetota bacterium]HIL36502.1 hypothetical protein [Planctomycetota bacterium]
MPRQFSPDRSHWDRLEDTPPPSPLLNKSELIRVFEAERVRTERTGSIFSLVVFTMGSKSEADLSKAVRTIEKTARLYDAIGSIGEQSLGVILPECDPESALVFSDRVIERFGHFDLGASVKIYSYPLDWLDDDDEAQQISSDHRTILPKGKPHLKRPANTASEGSNLRSVGADTDSQLRNLMQGTPCEDLEPHFLVPLPTWRRTMDIMVSVPLLIVLSITLLPLLALLIKLDSKGKVLYKQPRVGQGGRHFSFIKFRSMYKDAEERRAALSSRNEQSGPVFKIKDDPRITRVGRWMRKLSIDELPQFWNVACGDMTLIGPRPPLPDEVAEYEPWQRRRLDFVGGLTCLWQIEGRSNIGFEEWVRLDLKYIRNRSWMLDLLILLRTPKAVLSGNGAD